jgi:2,5-diketo-D-gluconate reductase A
MQEINREGLAKATGLANFSPDRLVDLIDHNEITPVVNQIETTRSSNAPRSRS